MRRPSTRGTDGAKESWWTAILRPRAQPLPPPAPISELFISSTGCFVAVDEALGDGCLAAVVVDDLVWRITLEEWHSRQPESRWSSSRRRWLEEYDELCAERLRITTVARFYGAEEPRRR
ncbi:hypothetical protein V3N99_08480 [Dermatophilaceae bacterium Soc4.6]